MPKKKARAKVVKSRRQPKREYPIHSLRDAMVIAKALMNEGAGKSMSRILVAKAIGRTPSSSEFRQLLSSSIKYGLSEGSEKADKISPLPRAKMLFRPMSDSERVRALRDAAMEPALFQRVFEHYDGSPIPSDEFFVNVLEREFDVPAEYCDEFAALILDNAECAQILEDVSGKKYVMLDRSADMDSDGDDFELSDMAINMVDDHDDDYQEEDFDIELGGRSFDQSAREETVETRVFISHGRNMEVVDNVKTMLDLADLKYEIAIESESTAIPVPEKIKEAMRRCNAAIICVTQDGGSDAGINQNVLIEIGAAFVLYDQRVVLLWDKSIPVPSNLQGLYRCEVEGSDLSWSAGMKLMSALKKFKPQ